MTPQGSWGATKLNHHVLPDGQRKDGGVDEVLRLVEAVSNPSRIRAADSAVKLLEPTGSGFRAGWEPPPVGLGFGFAGAFRCGAVSAGHASLCLPCGLLEA